MEKGAIGMVDRFEKFSFMISEISRYWNRIAAAEMERYELKGPCVLYLLAMRRHTDGITAARLGEECGRDKADVSRALALMEQNGLVKKESGHQYRARLTLTDEGKKAAEHLSERAATAVMLGGKGLSDEQRTALYDILALIAANLRTVSKTGLPSEKE